MSIKGTTEELFVHKAGASIIGFFGNKTKIEYSELSKIEYSYFRFGVGGGYLRFIDITGKTKEFNFNYKNNDQITKAIEIISENNPHLEIVQRKAEDLKFYQRTWFIIILLFCCCFPLGLFLMWYYKKLPRSIMIMITIFFIFMPLLGLYAGYQSYSAFQKNLDATFGQMYNEGRPQTSTSNDDASPQVSTEIKDRAEYTAPVETTASLTVGQDNALKSARGYLSIMAFSRDGLIKQLGAEGYTNGDATYAVDNCGADWDEQAAIAAQGYLDIMAFSRDGLIKQLEAEGYTSDQAEYAASAVGY